MGRRTRNHEFWLTREFGGAPVWMMILAAFVVAGVAVFAMTRPPEPEYVAQPRETPSETASPTPSAEPMPVALFIGDSYTDGAGATDDTSRWTTLVSVELGWAEVNYGFGGTGYATALVGEVCTRDECPAYPGAVELAAGEMPDVIVVSGGRNDSADMVAFQAGVDATFEALAATFPGVPVVVTSPLWDDDPAPDDLAQKAEIVEAAAASAGATYLDLGQPLFGHAEYVIDDGIHPDDDGHAAIAETFVAAY